MGAHTIAWIFILCDSAILFVIFGSRRVFFDDWISILLNVGDDMLTLITSILLLVSIHKKIPRLHLPFILGILFAFKALVVGIGVIVSLESAVRHHVSGIHTPNYYNLFVHFNMYDVFYSHPNAFLYMLFFLVLKVVFVGFYGYFVSIIIRSYFLLAKEQDDYTHFCNPDNFSASFHQEEKADENEKENP